MRRLSVLLVSGALALASLAGLSAPANAAPGFYCGPLLDPACQAVCRAIHRPCT